MKSKLTEMKELLREMRSKKMSFFYIVVQMKGFKKNELIVNHVSNLEKKIEYYLKTYDANLNHKFADGVKIVSYGIAHSLEDITFEM
ncbi:hypothetical protein FC686_07460 [Bacillus cereus]|uniref:hypothetical protein n=1 Tax=Bacillus cereus TaxID=1396 RepID=UPI0010BF3BE0|nr:hypothetical protein [Bacillus cereus]TKH81013.1 hypothetical protein FC686_07460 [Bacillus cereus]